MKRKIFKILFIGIVFSIFSTISFPNDWEFGSRGEHIIPLQNSEVVIKKEKITMKIVEEGIFINVKFVFDSPVAESKIIGFVSPENAFEENGNYKEIEDSNETESRNDTEVVYENEKIILEDKKIKDFETTVNGEIVKSNIDLLKNVLSRGILDKDKIKDYEDDKYQDSSVYYFNANFIKGENTVEHSYFYTGSYGIYERDFEYVLTTISKWKGQKVEDFELILDTGNYFVRLPYTFWNDNKKIDWEIVGEGKLAFVDETTVKHLNEEYRERVFVKLKNGYIRYKAKNFAPDLEFFMFRLDNPLFSSYILPSEDVQGYKFKDKFFTVSIYTEKRELERFTDEELEIIRNYPYAIEGYDFSKKDLKEYFSQFFWYVPLSKNIKISSSYENLIKNIEEIMNERTKKVN